MARLFDGLEKEMRQSDTLIVSPLLAPLFEDGLLAQLIEQLKDRIESRIWGWFRVHADDDIFVVEYRFIGIKIVSMTIKARQLEETIRALLEDEKPKVLEQTLV